MTGAVGDTVISLSLTWTTWPASSPCWRTPVRAGRSGSLAQRRPSAVTLSLTSGPASPRSGQSSRSSVPSSACSEGRSLSTGQMINKLLLWEKVPSAGRYVETIRHWIKSTVLLWSPSVPNSRDYFSGFSRNMTYIIMRICFIVKTRIACIFYHLAFLQFLMEPLNVTNGTTFVLKPRKGVKKKFPPFISLDSKCCQDTSGSVNVLWFIISLESSTSTRKSEHFGWQNVYTEICHYQGTKLSLQWDCQCCVSFRAGTVPNKNPWTAGGQEETNRRKTGGSD